MFSRGKRLGNAIERLLYDRNSLDSCVGAQVALVAGPLPLDMLPYGSTYLNGAPAAFCDISLGTHLHAWCYLKDETDERPPLAVFHDRVPNAMNSKSQSRSQRSHPLYYITSHQ